MEYEKMTNLELEKTLYETVPHICFPEVDDSNRQTVISLLRVVKTFAERNNVQTKKR